LAGDFPSADLEGTNYKLPQWAAAAAEFGYKTIRDPQTPAEDAKDATLIALARPDEPDLSNHWYGKRPPAGWPAGVKSWYDWTAPDGSVYSVVGKEYGNPPKPTGGNLADTVFVYREGIKLIRRDWPPLPIFGNFAGNAVTSGMQTEAYTGFTADLDWGGSDWYPVDHDLTPIPVPAGQSRRYGYDFPARAVSRLLTWSGGKPQFAYIACVSQRLDLSQRARWRWPTVAEIRAQIWAAIGHD
jgi:hypothetical protein